MRAFQHFPVLLLVFITRLSSTASTSLANSDASTTFDSELCPISNDQSATCSENPSETNQMTQSKTEFIPTKDWQQILPNQHLPPGLHIRMNLETGLKEAKLLDKSDSASDGSMVIVTSDAEDDSESNGSEAVAASKDANDLESTSKENVQKGKKFEPKWNSEKIYEVLQQLPEPPIVEGMDLAEARSKLSPAEFRKEIIRLWKKRQQDLKEAMDSMQDDSTFLLDLIDQLRNAKNLQGKLNVLETLEWEVQNLDKSRVFHYIGGFEIMTEYLDDEDFKVAAYAAWVIGSASKNFNEAQVWAIEAGAMPKLIHVLSRAIDLYSQDSKQFKLVWESKKKSLYAISSIMRAEERAQRYFLQHDGLSVLLNLLDPSVPYNLQLKVVLLVHDLLLEASNHADLSQRPALTDLRNAFRSATYCDRITDFFIAWHEQLQPSHLVDTVVILEQQSKGCQSVFQAKHLIDTVDKQEATWRVKLNQLQRQEELQRLEQAFHKIREALTRDDGKNEEL